jgi:hypothetical protein
MSKEAEKGTELVRVQVRMQRNLYLKLWEYIKQKYPIPYKKLHIAVNEAIKEYLERRGMKVE